MPISHDIVNLKRNSTFSSWSGWNKFLKRFSGSTKECATEDQILNHNLVNISFFKFNELGHVGKCVKHSFRIYMGCYLQFCITKKLWPINKNLSKLHFFHILSAHAKGLKHRGPPGPDSCTQCSIDVLKVVLYSFLSFFFFFF